MKLKKLLKDIAFKLVKGPKDLDITGVCANSKLVAPGNLFVARKGKAEDGSQYIPEAIAAGAVAIVTDIYDPLLNKDVTQLIHPDVTALEGQIAAHYYQNPSKDLFMVGITGTNGKTTTSFLVKHLLDHLSGPCGLIGTIEYIIGPHRYKATRTTPDVSLVHKLLREMSLQGCQNAVMEVTSHALDQNRVDYVEFDTVVFTNLTLDHLDYHGTMENYCKAKNRLFRALDGNSKKKTHAGPKMAIVNADSPWHKLMLENCQGQILTYGIAAEADLRASDITLTPDGTSLIINYKGQKVSAHYALAGRFNVYNYLAAVAVGLSRHLPLKQITDVLALAPAVSGRLEPVANPLGLKIYVDFAHSDDALLNILECLQEFKTGKVIVVFGCGGNRDVSKRPKMAQVCESHADFAVVTSDNPRNEDPAAIIKDVVKGFTRSDKYMVEIERAAAIEKAIQMATKDDIVLIAGKGHETYQIFSHKTIEFDDRKVALQICQKHADAKRSTLSQVGV